MQRREITVLLAALLLSAAIAACGGDGASNEADTNQEPTQTVSANEYANGVCHSYVGWLKGMQQETQELFGVAGGDASPEESKEAFLGFFTGAAERTDNLIAEVQKVGAPDVEGGNAAYNALIDGLEKTQQSFETARSKAEDLPTDSQQEFQAGAQEISSSLAQETSGLRESMDVTKKSKDLRKAFEEAKECRSSTAPDGGGQ